MPAKDKHGSFGGRVLFLAPLPPPVTGHSLAAQVVLEALRMRWRVTVVDLGIGSKHDGRVTWRRLATVGRALIDTWRGHRRADAIYLTISESFAGNLKDLVIYFLCVGRLDRMVLHLHGGSIGRELFDRRPLIKRLNSMAIGRMRGVILTGHSHLPIVDGMIDRARVHLIPNFADDSLFLSEAAIRAKFSELRPLRILYLSGMTTMKGYEVLLDAYLALTAEQQRGLHIDFAGAFDDPVRQRDFEERIANVPGLQYHGFAGQERRETLFAGAHVFCLPTSFHEGQPLSILEAYASGCVVVTTGQPGIRDVFSPGLNGWEIAPGSVESLRSALTMVTDPAAALLPIAVNNHAEAELRYRHERFTDAVLAVINPPA